jgi:F-type H+-transporting ATPase subunit alpha
MPNVIVEELKKEILNFKNELTVEESGSIAEIGDGIAKIYGLKNAKAGEILEFITKSGQTIQGLALNLEESTVGAVILGDFAELEAGDAVKVTGQVMAVPATEDLFGRVVNPLGEPLDGKGDIKAKKMMPTEVIAPGVITRETVNQPVQTGIKAIDSMIPIGRGQRELIIGDRGTGKTAVVVDTIINQKDSDIISIYVAIGQKESKIAKLVANLEERGAMEKTIIVVAGASDPAPLWYLAPYAGVAIAEYFMAQGKDVLIAYDDLSKHAWAYRQISLLLRRPPGREAYPGDVFYLHSRLLERSAKLNKDFGGGSITALPIIETQAGDISAYIPTNVISITDGQIFLESDLFYKGQRPAVNVGLSVSRVGGSAQIKAMKKVAGKLRLDLAQFRELEAFSQFSSDLDENTKAMLERGRRLTEALKQPQYQPWPVEEQVLVLYAAVNGYFDATEVEKLNEVIADLMISARSQIKADLAEIKKTGDLDEKVEASIKDFLEKNLPKKAEKVPESSKES